jgi:hypothetical protein|tara:strand:+ start:1027 stop:1194 length:168 start_codon:yes stop_codon:yes gene_type:complete
MKLATTRGQMIKWSNFVFSYFSSRREKERGESSSILPENTPLSTSSSSSKYYTSE